jgi:hypothetical protein
VSLLADPSLSFAADDVWEDDDGIDVVEEAPSLERRTPSDASRTTLAFEPQDDAGGRPAHEASASRDATGRVRRTVG